VEGASVLVVWERKEVDILRQEVVVEVGVVDVAYESNFAIVGGRR
jgi:hypothetical protein